MSEKKKQRELAKYLLEVGGASKALLLAKGFSRMVIKQVSEAKGITIESRFKAQKPLLMNYLQKK